LRNLTTNDNISSNKQIKSGAIISYVSIFIEVIIALIYTPYMISKIGKSDYGLYMLAMSVITLFVMDFGIGAAVTKYLSKYRAEGDEKSTVNFLGIIVKLYLIIDSILFVVMLITFTYINNIFTQLTAQELDVFRIVFIISALFSLYSLLFSPLNGIIVAYERFTFLKSIGIVSKILSVMLIVILLQFSVEVYLLVLINAFVGIVVSFIKFRYVKLNIKLTFNIKYSNKKLLKQIFGFSGFVFLAAILEQLTVNIGPAILASVSGGTNQIAYYAIGQTMYIFVLGFANSLNGLFLPKVSRLLLTSSKEKITSLMIKVGRIQLIILGLLILGLITMGYEFMTLWMGEEYVTSYFVVICLIIPYIIISTLNIAYMTMIAEGEMFKRVVAALVSTSFSLVIGILSAEYYGAIGVALGVAIGNIIGNIICMCYIYNKYLNINILYFFKECHLKLIKPILITLCFGFFQQVVFQTDGIVFFALKAIILTVVYIATMWFMGLNTYEKSIANEILKKLKSLHA
jgi:O-antigen/teichoic acid export membrane protein